MTINPATLSADLVVVGLTSISMKTGLLEFQWKLFNEKNNKGKLNILVA